jgi:dihydroorotate dehydrogenase (NAD+) catalytic subunit
MSIEFCGLSLAHPVINGSGTFDLLAAERVFGEELALRFPFAAYVSKTITLLARAGNPPPRLWEAQAGLINSIGLPNKGLEGYLADDLPGLHALLSRARVGGRETPGAPLITNVMGSSTESFSELVEACDAREEIAAIELNVSCPNVKTGLDIGADPKQLEALVLAVRGLTRKPLIVKLTPNTADVALCALGAQAGGADAVSLINTLRASALNPRRATDTQQRWLGGGSGGLSGPAIRAIALAQVAAVAALVAIPVIGMGGVQSAIHARELLDVGATLIAVGTESFCDPEAAAKVARGLQTAPPRTYETIH